MAEPPDIDSLARRFLDLWQEQLAVMATDPEFAASAQRVLTALNPVGKEGAAGDESATFGRADRAAASGDASGAGDGQLRRLERRIAALEERLAALESGAEREGGVAGRRRGAGGS